MPAIDTKIRNEVDALVTLGAQINRKVSSAERHLPEGELAEVAAWVTRLGMLIRKLYGEQSQPFVSYASAASTGNFYNLWKSHHRHITEMVGIAQAIKHEIDNDLLADFRSLLQAEVFADFLEMGEHLLEEGYKDAAAVIIGSVLEDRLRRLCTVNNLPLIGDQGKPLTIDPLNSQLAKADVYNKLVQKQITTWAHVRNKAAHGQYSEYDAAQVRAMLTFVQGFAG